MIFIATKGRAGKSTIIQHLLDEHAPLFLFVEPQEIEAYKKAYPKAVIVNIELNNQGLPFVRQFMLNFANEQGLPLYWNLDDDVQLYRVEDGKCIKSDWSVLRKAEEYFKDDSTVAQAGLEYRQFAWSATKPYSYNSYCDCVVAIKPHLCANFVFDNNVLLKLDRDFSIQVINAGHKTMKINRYAFSSPENGSNEGGLYDAYKSGIEEANSKAMELKWGKHICEAITKPNGRKDVKIYWKNIGKAAPAENLSLF